AAIAERREIRIGRVEGAPDVAHPVWVLLEVEGLHVVARVRLAERHVAHERLGKGELERLAAVAADQPAIPAARGLRLAERRGAHDPGAERLAREVGLAAADHASIDRAESAGLRIGHAARAVAAGAPR